MPVIRAEPLVAKPSRDVPGSHCDEESIRVRVWRSLFSYPNYSQRLLYGPPRGVKQRLLDPYCLPCSLYYYFNTSTNVNHNSSISMQFFHSMPSPSYHLYCYCLLFYFSLPVCSMHDVFCIALLFPAYFILHIFRIF